MNTDNLLKNSEEWASIDGYKNYQVSWWGRVRNTKTGRILKANPGSHGYLAVGLSKKGVSTKCCIHKLLAQEWVANPDGKKCVDHIDGDKLNNHWENLRWATYAENSRNRAKRANATSSYYGVSWSKQSNKWTAQIEIEGKRTNLGFYTDEKKAAQAFNKAAIEHYGEYARLNEFSESESESETRTVSDRLDEFASQMSSYLI